MYPLEVPNTPVAFWTTAIISAGLVITGVVLLLLGLYERRWPECPGKILDFYERSYDGVISYYPQLYIWPKQLAPRTVVATRPVRRAPWIGERVTVKHHPEFRKIWVKGKTRGTLPEIGFGCIFLAVVIPIVISGTVQS